ncbi:site-specific DNA-methyltransferase [Enterococcus faecium]|nr:site-specific DNA-methyltransferase [Enterococcus faecium]
MSDRPEKINLSDVHSRQVDTDLLNELRDLFVKAEEQKERYDFTWNGKAKAYFEAAAPTTKTLRAQPEESVNFESSENLFITGDNLETLKLLQESYLGKIDMIYIDPPYNTGKDFVYQDNFKKTQKENDVSEGILDEDGNRLVKNEKSNGRYHSDWLTMMYPRLKLARNLLSDSGVIFVSIDDNEQANLRLLMDEIFKESNYQTTISRLTGTPTGNGNATFVNEFDYLLVYSKDNANFKSNGLPLSEKQQSIYNEVDEQGKYLTRSLRRTGGEDRREDRPSMYFGVEAPDSTLVYPIGPSGYESRWVVGEATYKRMEKENLIAWKNVNGEWKVYQKFYLEDRTQQPSNLWKENVGNKKATKEVRILFDNQKVFDFPKPVDLIVQAVTIGANKYSTILDFFAGSGTTADAVMQLNAKDGGNRKFIVATLDEETPENSEARKAGYTTIDQISRERIRRAAEKIGDTNGFRALRVDSTGLKENVFKTAGELDQVDLLQDIDNHSDNRSDYDLLYDVLVDGALEYNRPITIDAMNNEKIIKYDYLGELSGVVCYFGENLTDELTRQIATLKPLLAVFKESTFDKSAQKVNVMEQFRIISPDTKVKVI